MAERYSNRWLYNEDLENPIKVLPYSNTNVIYYPRYYGEGNSNNKILTEVLQELMRASQSNLQAIDQLKEDIEAGLISSGGGGGGGNLILAVPLNEIVSLFNDENNTYYFIGEDSEALVLVSNLLTDIDMSVFQTTPAP